MTTCLFTPSSELTFETVQHNQERFIKVISEHPDTQCVRIDLSKVMHCDSTGLALLIEAKRLCLSQHKQFMLDNMSESISALATFCGVNEVLFND